jgi:hypothetical protein
MIGETLSNREIIIARAYLKNMNKIILTLILNTFLIYTDCYSQGKIQIRPSIGWAKGYNAHNFITSNTNSINYQMQHDKYEYLYNRDKVIDRLTNVQIGLMFEYLFNKHHTLGIGFMTGGTESKFTTYINDPAVPLNYVTDGSYGKYLKKGLEYTYTYNIGCFKKGNNQFLNRFNTSLLLGMFLINNQITDYSPNIIRTYQDNQMNTIDSFISPAKTIQDRGFMLSGGLRLSYLSKKHKEKVSVTILYDHGFSKLVLFESKVYFNHLNNYIIGQQISFGSQIKLYISFPINMYYFKKDKLNFYNKE